jgi:hypothetical protein
VLRFLRRQSRLGVAWLAMCLGIAAYVSLFLPPVLPRSNRRDRDTLDTAVAEVPGGGRLAAESNKLRKGRLITKSIADVRLGERVFGENPLRHQAELTNYRSPHAKAKRPFTLA